MNKWIDEWPTTPGYYWFYGWRFRRFNLGDKPELCFVEVRRTGNKKMMYVTHGHFLYPQEGGKGKWQKAVLPKLPIVEG